MNDGPELIELVRFPAAERVLHEVRMRILGQHSSWPARLPSSAGIDRYESRWAGPAPIPMGRDRGELRLCRDPGPVGDRVLPAGPVERKIR